MLLEIVHKLYKTSSIEGLILGGTKLPLILKDTDVNEIPFLDTYFKSFLTAQYSNCRLSTIYNKFTMYATK